MIVTLETSTYPYQSVNHFKVMSHTVYQEGQLALELNLAYQNNHRKELTEPIAHGYMPTPPNSLEREFKKDTYTANLMTRYDLNERHSLSAGVNGEYQHNRRAGGVLSFLTLKRPRLVRMPSTVTQSRKT